MAGNADPAKDAFTVYGNDWEGSDKKVTLWENADDLINAITTVNVNAIVVVRSVGPVILKTWIGRLNVAAILRVWAGLPRQEKGCAVLSGDVERSGCLSYTVAKSAVDYPAQLTTGRNENKTIVIE